MEPSEEFEQIRREHVELREEISTYKEKYHIKLEQAIQENNRAQEKLSASIDQLDEALGGEFSNKQVDGLEKRAWQYKKEYELKVNPKQVHLNNLISTLRSERYNLTIFDPHSVLSIPTEQQSHRSLWIVGWDQELHIYAKKADEELMIKKEVFCCGPLTFWYSGLHYLVEIYKNNSSFEDKRLLDIIKYASHQSKKSLLKSILHRRPC